MSEVTNLIELRARTLQRRKNIEEAFQKTPPKNVYPEMIEGAIKIMNVIIDRTIEDIDEMILKASKDV